MTEIADECCNGDLVLLLEGGYSLEALRESVAAVIERLREPQAFGGDGELTSWGAATRQAVASYWKI
jgi:acetoin utilization deacetylase AcuC-like enzyme